MHATFSVLVLHYYEMFQTCKIKLFHLPSTIFYGPTTQFWIYRMIHGIVLWYNGPGVFGRCGPPKGQGSFRGQRLARGWPEVKDKGHLKFKVKGHLGIKSQKSPTGQRQRLPKGQCQRSLRVKVKGHPWVIPSHLIRYTFLAPDPWVNFDLDPWMTPHPWVARNQHNHQYLYPHPTLLVREFSLSCN